MEMLMLLIDKVGINCCWTKPTGLRFVWIRVSLPRSFRCSAVRHWDRLRFFFRQDRLKCINFSERIPALILNFVFLCTPKFSTIYSLNKSNQIRFFPGPWLIISFIELFIKWFQNFPMFFGSPPFHCLILLSTVGTIFMTYWQKFWVN